MRRNYLLSFVLLIACAVLLLGACGRTVTTVSNSSGNANANAGTRDGAGPHNNGIGGTGEDRRDAVVGGNSNVEPTGVNKNAGGGTNANLSTSNSGTSTANSNR